jgi:hypothetical protein
MDFLQLFLKVKIVNTIMVISIFSCFTSFAQLSEKEYASKRWKCIDGNCIDGKGTIEDVNFKEHKITGQFKQGLLDGLAHWEYKPSLGNSGFVFDGYFIEGKRQKGKWICNDSSSYEGEYLNGEMNGEGSYKSISVVSKGTWEKNTLVIGKHNYITGLQITLKKNDTGKSIAEIKYENEDYYEGEVNGLRRDGKGKIKEANLETYIGDWKYDNKHGNGIKTWPNGDIYEGSWKRNSRSGFGKMIWTSLNKEYVGEWILDKPNGKGIYNFKDGNKIIGQDSGYFYLGVKIADNKEVYDNYVKNIEEKNQEKIEFFKKSKEDYNNWLNKTFKVETKNNNCVTYILSHSSISVFGTVSSDSYLMLIQVEDKTNKATEEQIVNHAEEEFNKHGISGYTSTKKLINKNCNCSDVLKAIKAEYKGFATINYEISYSLPIEK